MKKEEEEQNPENNIKRSVSIPVIYGWGVGYHYGHLMMQ